jgi:RHS repeat-associated protein
MKRLIRMRTLRALCVLLAVAGQGAVILAQNGPPNKDRYIVVLKPPKNGVPALSDHDITAGGGKIEYKVPGRIQVTLPAPAVEAMRKQERVKYIQKVILGPLPDASAPAALRMTPLTASLRATPESTPPTWRSGTYKYDASGNIYAIGVAGDTGSPVQHRYAYDVLSRLKQADTLATPTRTETFTYDVYGNLIEHIDGSSTTSTPVENPNTNRLAWSAAHPYTYDAAGNLTADYNATYAYDAFNMLREKDYTNEVAEYYMYTASDERIGVKYGTSSGSPTIWSIRDFSGNVLRQYEGHDQSPQMAWLWVEDYVYRDGQLLAAERVPEEGGRRHFHLDHLGSPRLVTGDDSREMSDHDYKPFGLESNFQETAGGFDREDPKRFTGHERDYAPPGETPASTAYLDYMHARSYNPTVARFLSIDPVLSKGVIQSPQIWNRYSYVANNPLKHVDPDGKWIRFFDGDYSREVAFAEFKKLLPKNAQQFVVMDKNGYARLKGISRSDFAAFGGTTAKLGAMIAQGGWTANVRLEASSVAADGGGAATRSFGNKTDIEINPFLLENYGGSSVYKGGVQQTIGSAMAHELLGHAYPYAFDVDIMSPHRYGWMNSGPKQEGYAIWAENEWRAEQGRPLRTFYTNQPDYVPPDN